MKINLKFAAYGLGLVMMSQLFIGGCVTLSKNTAAQNAQVNTCLNCLKAATVKAQNAAAQYLTEGADSTQYLSAYNSVYNTERAKCGC